MAELSEAEIIQTNLANARVHLRYVLMNQGIDWDEADESASLIENRLRATNPAWSDETITSCLISEAAPYEDM